MEKILVADDDADCCEIMQTVLEQGGVYKVDTAQYGNDVLKLLTKENYLLLICDLSVIEESNLVIEIRCRKFQLPILVISGSGPKEIPMTQGFLQKPIRMKSLQETIAKLICR